MAAQSLKLVDTTTTSSWMIGRRVSAPMASQHELPGPGHQTRGTDADLFFFTLYNQPMYLDAYSNNGTPAHTVPYNSQYKCYDGMHNWNQLQPAPYDGRYQFPSVDQTAIPVTGAADAERTAPSASRIRRRCTDFDYNAPMLPARQVCGRGRCASRLRIGQGRRQEHPHRR